ncbi:MAG: AtpZ/AtpI family protein [Chloroflexota bacterium]|nr:AtpZ/AtpI family protein [Chloroflexota bacterium]
MSNSFGPEDIKGFSALGPAQGLGCSIVASLLVFILGGVFLDQYLDTAPLLTLIGVAIGLFAAGYQLYELTLINRKDRRAGPIARTLESKLEPRRREKSSDRGDDVQ